MDGNYSVRIERFAERHFIKSFEKKYKSHWWITLRAITAELERNKRDVAVLLVYGKTDLSGGNETANWKRIIKDNYSDLRDIL